MKKSKNDKLNESNTAPVQIKEGKIKKKKPKNVKKIEDAVNKTEDENLTPKNWSLDAEPNDNAHKKKNKKIPAKHEKLLTFEGGQKKDNVDNKTAKQDKHKSKAANKQKESQPETLPNDLSDADLKRIEKRKAKKLAQKLKKEKRKAESEVLNKETKTKTNGVKKLKEASPESGIADAAKKLASAGSKVLTKKRKAEKKVLNKGTESNASGVQEVITESGNADAAKKLDSTSSKVLAKKEKKAEKRKMIKEQKLAEKQTRNPAMEASTIFVGNLPVNTKRVQLTRLFKEFGPINSIRLRSAGGKVLLKHKQRKKAGSLNAYIVLKNKEAAEKAVSLNGVEFKDHHLRITLAEKNHEIEEAKRTVFVGNLTYSATEESLREIFTSCGEIDYVRCLRDGDKGCKGVAYVCFKTADGVGLGLELNGTIVDERPINVERYSVKKLGAKEARDALAEKEEKSKTGAKQRIDGKKEKKEKSAHKNNNLIEVDDAKKPKKSEFRGVKVEGLKKKPKSKKKKSNDQMLQLAKKIAPKTK